MTASSCQHMHVRMNVCAYEEMYTRHEKCESCAKACNECLQTVIGVNAYEHAKDLDFSNMSLKE